MAGTFLVAAWILIVSVYLLRQLWTGEISGGR
jgi:hypothetical protein